jgi:hypothetical protein
MQKIILAVVVLVGILLVANSGLLEPAASKAYRSHREAVLESKGFSREMTSSRKWSLEIDDCTVDGNEAEIRATEKTSVIPPNAASFVFANITTRVFEARLEERSGRWVVVEEKIVDEQFSTYQDRKP